MQRRWLFIFLVLIFVTQACSVNSSATGVEDVLVEIETTPIVTTTTFGETSANSEPTTSTIPATATPVVLMESAQPPSISAAIAVDNVSTDPQDFAKITTLGETYIYAVQLGSPVAIPNWPHPELGCKWLGLAGQIFGLDGVPEQGIIVEAGGTLDGETVLGLSLTGMTDLYGPGSYEIQLADHVVWSQKQVWVQVKGTAGEALSPQILIDTYNNCGKNLILLNFIQVDPYTEKYQIYLPWIMLTQP